MLRALVCCVILAACDEPTPPPEQQAPIAQPPARIDPPPSRISALPVADHLDAVVMRPHQAGARPLVILLHGMGDSPDSLCPAFDRLVHGRAWILCPRGIEYGDGWTYPLDRVAVRGEIAAAVAALRAREPDVDADAPLLAGFSLGAMYAALLSKADAPAFPRTFAIDTHRVWSAAELSRYTARGGRRVAFVCSHNYVRDCQRLCTSDGDRGIVRCQLVADREHGYDRELFERIAPLFEATLDGDPRWR